ncbi:uncharacterized protein LOC116417731 [Nasonia vitripennis]|uniref:Helitron helicase-like domain-containing protein n=1 Tax=Nasonia vitripennis TaxID=7425 RepID=A0A7M7TB18_NASVI|nr:uncharacterized protein LOC116417731 [Nasonia vitripennis]
MDPNVEPWIYALFYPYAMDFYVKIEKDRIQYIRDYQKEIRADTYKGLHDYMENAATDVNARIGKTIILPSTFIGSPGHMQQCYQDAMAIVSEKGKPCLFLTMTCNPKWKEIEENLLPHQQAADRPDLCARIFDLKKQRLLDFVIKNKYFGGVAAYVYVIEFKKRGLPHMDLLITLKHGFKITTPEIVDRFISAEIPNANETVMDGNGYPYYRRRDNGTTHEQSNGRIVDNRWAVPYCPTLLEMFNCHINVEAVSSIRAVKYMYKYIYKGHDAANVVLTEQNEERVINHDEIKDYLEARYVVSVEAAYRILSKLLQDKSHCIIRLPIHLPMQYTIIIPNDLTNVQVNLDQFTSMILDYFKLNSEDENARQYLYKDIPCDYVHKKNKVTKITQWGPRKGQFNVFGRIRSVNPSEFELFHLRLLLLNVKVATSSDALKTVDGQLLPSFSAACLA